MGNPYYSGRRCVAESGRTIVSNISSRQNVDPSVQMARPKFSVGWNRFPSVRLNSSSVYDTQCDSCRGRVPTKFSIYRPCLEYISKLTDSVQPIKPMEFPNYRPRPAGICMGRLPVRQWWNQNGFSSFQDQSGYVSPRTVWFRIRNICCPPSASCFKKPVTAVHCPSSFPTQSVNNPSRVHQRLGGGLERVACEATGS